jgi:hypothetical protein
LIKSISFPTYLEDITDIEDQLQSIVDVTSKVEPEGILTEKQVEYNILFGNKGELDSARFRKQFAKTIRCDNISFVGMPEKLTDFVYYPPEVLTYYELIALMGNDTITGCKAVSLDVKHGVI